METRICSKCKIEKPSFEFNKDKSRKGGFRYYCRNCEKQYRQNNVKQISKQKKQYCQDNAKQISKRKKQYYIDNIISMTKKHAQYRKDNKEQLAQRAKSNAKFKLYCDRLKQFEEIRCCPENKELLEVRCSYCGKWMKPTVVQTKNRLQVFNGTLRGEARFYCSEHCKQVCPIYDQNKYPKGFKQATSREVVPLLRQLVLARDNYTCQKCGATTETAQLHVHHIISYAQNKMQANDPDSCITFCKECHKKVHQQDGCKYIDLIC
jgi:5-methylcytosine-specific restriction endonuclease McrA